MDGKAILVSNGTLLETLVDESDLCEPAVTAHAPDSQRDCQPGNGHRRPVFHFLVRRSL